MTTTIMASEKSGDEGQVVSKSTSSVIPPDYDPTAPTKLVSARTQSLSDLFTIVSLSVSGLDSVSRE